MLLCWFSGAVPGLATVFNKSSNSLLPPILSPTLMKSLAARLLALMPYWIYTAQRLHPTGLSGLTQFANAHTIEGVLPCIWWLLASCFKPRWRKQGAVTRETHQVLLHLLPCHSNEVLGIPAWAGKPSLSYFCMNNANSKNILKKSGFGSHVLSKCLHVVCENTGITKYKKRKKKALIVWSKQPTEDSPCHKHSRLEPFLKLQPPG